MKVLFYSLIFFVSLNASAQDPGLQHVLPNAMCALAAVVIAQLPEQVRATCWSDYSRCTALASGTMINQCQCYGGHIPREMDKCDYSQKYKEASGGRW